jgi:hypothetical protein
MKTIARNKLNHKTKKSKLLINKRMKNNFNITFQMKVMIYLINLKQLTPIS